jgi:transposase
MTAALSNDLRLRVVNAIDDGLSRRSAANKFDVSIASAVRWHQRYRETGHVHPKPIGGDRHSHHIEVHAGTILGWIDDKRDLTLAEIRDRLAQEGHRFSITAIWRLLKRHDYTVKKRPLTPTNKSAKT